MVFFKALTSPRTTTGTNLALCSMAILTKPASPHKHMLRHNSKLTTWRRIGLAYTVSSPGNDCEELVTKDTVLISTCQCSEAPLHRYKDNLFGNQRSWYKERLIWVWDRHQFRQSSWSNTASCEMYCFEMRLQSQATAAGCLTHRVYSQIIWAATVSCMIWGHLRKLHQTYG